MLVVLLYLIIESQEPPSVEVIKYQNLTISNDQQQSVRKPPSLIPPLYPLLYPFTIAGVFSTPSSGSLGCLLARQLCLEDSACNQILQVIPRVCGLELGESCIYHGRLLIPNGFIFSFMSFPAITISCIIDSAVAHQGLVPWCSP